MQTIYEVSILLVDDNPDLLALVSDSLRTGRGIPASALPPPVPTRGRCLPRRRPS